MIPFGLKTKTVLVLVAIAAIGYGGWMARGWFEDSKDLVAMKAQEALAAEIRAGQAKISKQVEDRLKQLRANERVIDRGVIREIQKPIYKRVCFEPELVRLLNDAQAGHPGKPDGEVPGESASAAERKR